MRVSRLIVPLFLALAGLSGPVQAASNGLVRVPQDARTLDAAITRVADGGVIEMAAGTYPSPPNGFAINNLRKGFTVRAAAGAAVAIDGGGSHNLVRFINSDRGRGKRVTFQGLTFQNGYTANYDESGGVTLSAAEALFQRCSFVGNRAASALTGGGAVKAIAGSSATFVGCSFRGNSSPLRGGAIAIRSSAVTIQGGDLTGNRTNLPGHNPNSFGGAIMVLDGSLSVSGVRFDGNQAGWVGGAIYAIGSWDQGSSVFVTGSTFVNNQSVPDPCCTQASPTSGGAIHAEDLTTLRVHDSLFQLNRADVGAAVDEYRADTEIDGSVFQRNVGTASGAIAAISSDFPDASTGNGAINRRAARLVVTQSLIQGGGQDGPPPASGACILASGDVARMYGNPTTPPSGTLADNRAPVVIRGVVFSDCDVAQAADGSGGMGGALVGDLIDLDMEDSMVLDSDARGTNAAGGGVALRQESNVRILRTTFANDTAQKWGGALFLSGSTVLVDACRFYGNDVVPGVFEGLSESRGAAIYSIPLLDPARPRNVGGEVSSSVFSGNLGLPVWDVDPQSGPINDLHYDGNRFDSNVLGNLVYVDTLASPGGASAVDLNFLTVYRGGRPATRKSSVPNAQVFNLSEGDLRIVPSPNSVGANPPAPTASDLAYAWTGSSAAIATIGLAQKTGILEVPVGDYALRVDQTLAATAKAVGSCTAGPYLCLAGDRFRAEVTWKANGAAAPAQAVSLSGDTGYFWFVDPANVELVVKVLDGRGINGSFWVFYGGLTNLAYTLTITDTVTGAVKVYTNPAGRFASAGDTSAFPAAGAAAVATAALPTPDAAPGAEDVEKAACAPGTASLCLAGSRFQVQLTWKDFSGKTGVGQAVPLTGDTGYFWFTSPDNVEVVVKILDGRALNGHFWVFYGALSNLEYTITVIDTQTGARKTYTNPPKKFGSQGDTVALPG